MKDAERAALRTIASRLAGDASYRAAILGELERGQFREFRRYWAFEEEAWVSKHLDEVRRRAELLEVLALYAPIENARVLVIGAGFGAEAVALARAGAHVLALDLDRDLLRFVGRRAREHEASFARIVGDGLRPPFRAASFDWVLLRQVLEHVPRARQAPLLAAAGALLRPGGHLFVDTPNRRDPIDRHDTGLPFVHWLPRALRVRLAQRLGRAVPTYEAGADGAQVHVHDFATLREVRRALPGFEMCSRYKEYPSVAAWAELRAREGRRPSAVRRAALEVGVRWLGLAGWVPIRVVLQRVRG
ncbi:MAG: methyltransferase domain-containing protein [Planctomycetes bacterium]|nr:methyltransferase domain-containing protein [Planctomycetota bacterium]